MAWVCFVRCGFIFINFIIKTFFFSLVFVLFFLQLNHTRIRIHHISCISCVFRLIRLRNQSVNCHLNFNRNCSFSLSHCLCCADRNLIGFSTVQFTTFAALVSVVVVVAATAAAMAATTALHQASDTENFSIYVSAGVKIIKSHM